MGASGPASDIPLDYERPETFEHTGSGAYTGSGAHTGALPEDGPSEQDLIAQGKRVHRTTTDSAARAAQVPHAVCLRVDAGLIQQPKRLASL